jgi:cell division septation protein DedD
MQAETLTRICPLCRRAADDAHDAPGTRLCSDCRAMLAPILPRAGAVQPDYAVAFGAATLAQATTPPLAREVDFDEAAFAPAAGIDEDFALPDEDEEDDAPFDAQPAAAAPAEAAQAAFAQPFEATASEAFITPDLYEEPEAFIAPDQYEDDIEPTADTAAPLASPVAPAHAEQAGFVAEATAYESAPATVVAPSADLSADLSAEEATAPAAPPADPWDDPLPAWEYSHREWPLLVKDEPPSVASRLKWPLVAVLVIGIAAAAYFIFLRRHGEATVTQQALTVPVEQVPPPAPPAASPTPQASAAPAATEETKAAAPAPANPAAEGQWKHALQAMASPNEGEANAFADRLKTAAIPAYVVRAEVNGHVWYRVRVGRFATAEEAQRYAVEARNRARAVGVVLKELQVTAYDKP